MITKSTKHFLSHSTFNYGQKSDSSTTSTRNPPFTNLLEIYFKVTFFICYSPFLIAKSSRNGKFHVKQNKLQLFLCIIFGIFGLTYKVNQCMFGRSRLQNYDCPKSLTGLENPVSYLTKLSSFFGWLFRVKTLHQFWIQKNGFLNLVNCLQNAENFHLVPDKSRIRKLLNKTFLVGVLLVYMGVSLVSVIAKLSSAFPWESFGNHKNYFEMAYYILVTFGEIYM